MIFLSASIPDPKEAPEYFATADLFAIRDAVRALATVIIPNTHLVWGGHPAITPLIRYVMETMEAKVQEHVTLYQSLYYKHVFPKDNSYIEHRELTKAFSEEKQSLAFMRQEMLGNDKRFQAAFFIGGKKGVEDEYDLFCEMQPEAYVFPIASTGGAALKLFNRKDESKFRPKDRLFLTDRAYLSLFKTIMKTFL